MPHTRKKLIEVALPLEAVNVASAREKSVVVDEVIQRLTSQVGTEVEVTLEVKARKADGFDDQTVRTISENSRTLKFDHFEFEEG